MNLAISHTFGVPVTHYSSFEHFRKELSAVPLWFAVPQHHLALTELASIRDRVAIHAYEDFAVLSIKDPTPNNLAVLRAGSTSVFLNDPTVNFESFREEGIVDVLVQLGYRLFCSFSDKWMLSETIGSVTVLDRLSFLLSCEIVLRRYPVSVTSRLSSPAGTRRSSALFVLDLIQDIEILSPLIRRAAAPESPFQMEVAVSSRILKSHAWDALKAFLGINGISWFNPQSPLELVSRIGKGRALLVTASESSAPGHAFCHQACKIAPANTIRVTLQHGYECVGFKHHKAHDLQFPGGIRFASDVILVWQDPGYLTNLHPIEAGKCVPVGVVKAFAEDAAYLRERRWFGSAPFEQASEDGKTALLVAENLHSVRFVSLSRYQGFLSFISNANASPMVDLTIRSHPGKRTLEKDAGSNNYKFLQGTLTPDSVSRFEAFVSPPSTILLDSASIGVPCSVWSDAAVLGDASNYSGLSVVASFEDWVAARKSASMTAGMKWATRNTAALNGVPAAWAALVSLI